MLFQMSSQGIKPFTSQALANIAKLRSQNIAEFEQNGSCINEVKIETAEIAPKIVTNKICFKYLISHLTSNDANRVP
jgi:hypothetical protein